MMNTPHLKSLPAVLLAMLFLLVSTACDPGWELGGEVTISAATQQAFDDYPAQIVVYTQNTADRDQSTVNPREDTFRIGILCEPSTESATFTWTRESVGCSIRTEVTAWMAALPIEEGESCEELREKLRADAETNYYSTVDIDGPTDGAPWDRVYAFADMDEVECSTSSDHVELTLSAQ